MSGPARRESRGRGLLALATLATLAAVLVAPGAVRAADATFETPSAHAVLGEPVTFRQVFTTASEPTRVELVMSLPGEPGSDVQAADVSGSGSALVATAEIEDHVYPNTTFRYHFRVTFDHGEPVDGPLGTVTVVDDRFDWQTREGRHVTIHWYDADSGFGDRAVRLGDSAVDRAAELLGLDDVADVDYFVYASSEALYDAMGAGTSDNVGGQYYSPIRTAYADIAPYEADSDWADEVIVHELAHHVFDQATHNPYHEPPTWLNEGIAVYLAEGGAEPRAEELEAAVGDGDVLPLEALADAFPRTYRPFSLAYAESVSAVAFLIERHGMDGLGDLVARYRSGSSDDEAFSGALGESPEAFGRGWLESIGATAPPAYGPQPAPTGPLPPDWKLGGAAATPFPTAPGSTGAPPTSAATGIGTGSPATPMPTFTAAANPEQGGSSGTTGPWLIAGLAAIFIGAILVAVVLVERQGSRPREGGPPATGSPGAPR